MSSVDRKTYMAKLRLNEMLADHDVSLPADLYDEIASALREQPEARGVVDAPIEGPRLPSGGSIESKAKAWDEVVNVMDEVCPDWVRRSKVGVWAVCAAIREMAAAQQPVQEGGGEVCEFEGKACNEVPRGNGYCDRCAAGNYAQCRYTAPQSAPVGVDGCTESNCPRCLTHPDHRGDMAHAGIGGYPTQQPAQAVPGDADVRELLDAMDNGDDPRPAFIRLRKRYPPKSTPPGDDAAGGGS